VVLLYEEGDLGIVENVPLCELRLQGADDVLRLLASDLNAIDVGKVDAPIRLHTELTWQVRLPHHEDLKHIAGSHGGARRGRGKVCGRSGPGSEAAAKREGT